MKVKYSLILNILILLTGSLSGQINTYTYPSEVRESPFYRVTIRQGDSVYRSFVHVSECPDGPFAEHKIWITEQDRSMSFTNFSFTGKPVEITIEKLFGTRAHDVEITPKRFGIQLEAFDGKKVRFTLNQPEYISVRFVCDDNTDEYGNIKNGMMVFADEIEENPPRPDDPRVTLFSEKADLINAKIIYFPPGIHNLFDYMPDGRLILHDDQQVYIPGGTYVYGTLFAAGAHNIKLSGRGIISGNKHEFHYDGIRQLVEFDKYNTILNISRGSHHTLEGITLIESVNHTLVVPEKSLVKDVKFISWACNNDGLRSGDNCVIDHVFMKLCDDYFYANTTSLITRCILWPMFNGATLQLGWGTGTAGGTRFLHNDIINPEWDWIGSNTGFVASQVKPGACIYDLLVEDLHIDGNINALVNLDFALVPGQQYNWKGSIRNFTFRNIELDGRQIWYSSRGWDGYERLETQLSSDYNINPENPAIKGKSIIKGLKNDKGEIVWVENIRFENLKINGEWITEKNYTKYFEIDPQTTRNISFHLDSAVRVNQRPGPTLVSEYETHGTGFIPEHLKKEKTERAGWMTKNDSLSYTIVLPKTGEYEVRIGLVPVYGPATINITSGENETGSLIMDGYPKNAFRNIRKVHTKNFLFKEGENEIRLKVTEGVCIPDLLEIVPAGLEKGTAEYRAYTHWHGILRKSPSNWKGDKISYRLTEKEISFKGFNPENKLCRLRIYNQEAKEIKMAKIKTNRMTVETGNLSPGPYSALFTDDKNYWVMKQFVVYH